MRTDLTLQELLTSGEALLAQSGVPSPAHDARALAAHVLQRPQHHLWSDFVPSATQVRAFADLIDRRARRIPLQHLVGSTGFRYLDLAVVPGVFIPRPETETVAQAAIDAALAITDRAPLVVDLCTGAGPIAVSVASEVTTAQVVAVDVNPDAVALTRRNAIAAQVGALRLEQGDIADPTLLADLDGTVDIVVSNPPYIPPDAEPTEPEVRDHDPATALYGGGTDGLALPRLVLIAAARLLRPGGVVVMEHAEVQDAAVRAIASDLGFIEVTSRSDLSGRPRMVIGRRPAGEL